jgi:predicted nucleic-acid-binding protein
MIAVDTNVVIRLLTRDDERQYSRACRLFEKETIYISDTVLLETGWVLQAVYELGREHIFSALAGLIGLPNVQIDRLERIETALSWYRDGLDFADALHLAVSSPCGTMATFDKAFVKSAKGLSSCTVSLA